MADVDATIAALQTQLAALTTQITELQDGRSSASSSVSHAKLLDIGATSDPTSVPKFTALADIKHDSRNPVRREPHFPIDPQLIDLKGSRGYEAVAEGGVPAMLHEYRHHASYSSYNFDYLEAFKQLVPAVQDDELRKSFCVVLTGLNEVQRRVTNRLDFLRLYGEKRFSEPGLVHAVEQAIVGTADLPVSSSDVLDAVSSYRAQAQKIAIKQGASLDQSQQSWQGRGRGRGHPGRQFRQQQQQPGTSRDPYPLRNRAQQPQQQQHQQQQPQ